MKRLLVLGSSGMAGHVVTLYFGKREGYAVDHISHTRRLNETATLMDLTRIAGLDDYLRNRSYDVIVNCVGVLNRAAEDDKCGAILLNGYLPRHLERTYADTATKIIHLSTDCVFSGKQGDYAEDAFRDGDTYYDRTKILGELNNGKDLTIRTSIVGPDLHRNGIGLFNWFMRQEGEIPGYTRALWSGITSIELAKTIEQAIVQPVSGVYHAVARRKISKYELLQLFKSVFDRRQVVVRPSERVAVDKSLRNTRQDFRCEAVEYEPMIEEMRDWIAANRVLYPHYLP